METLQFDLTKECGRFKTLNGTNGGPWHKRHTQELVRSNLEAYKAARIPYSRNHDLAVNTLYGGPYSHDISNIFPDFDADPDDPKAYDFACTDEDIMICLEAGTKTFFRLGQTIEHQIIKHNTLPPKDFRKWAVICEHIIRHYNEGWADGYHLNMEYWEIWNEPDLDPDDAIKKRTWGGTKAQFFDFYETVAKHLKDCFPGLKIGGPAHAYRQEWLEQFIRAMRERHVPIDFFSWHIYCTEPEAIVKLAEKYRKLLDQYGYEKSESILNEWNYVKGGNDQYIYSVEMRHGIKGASFLTACICAAQHTSIDMMMYYDARPSTYNGIFDFYTARPLKGYYPMYWYGMLYDGMAEVRALNGIEDIYSLCGVDDNGKCMAMLTYYSDNDHAENKKIAVDFGRMGTYEVYRLDDVHSGELADITDCLEFDMKVHCVIWIRER